MGDLIDRSYLFAKLQAYTHIRNSIEAYRRTLDPKDYMKRRQDFDEVNSLLAITGVIISRIYKELKEGTRPLSE